MSKAELKGNAKPFDNSFVPAAARRAAEEADRLQAQLTAPPADQGDPNARPLPTNPVPEATPPAPAPTPPTAPAAPPADEDANDDSWKAKFLSEQGRTQKMRRDLDEMNRTVSDLRGVMATMNAAPAAPAEMHFEKPKLVTDAEIAEWSPELMDVIERAAQQIAQPQIDALKAQIEQLGGSVGKVQETFGQNARERMISTLDGSSELVGDWRALNEHPDFIAWLQNIDPLSGLLRHDLLKQAWNANDASRVAASFASFLKETNPVAPPPAPAPAPAPAAKPTLASLAAPGPSRAAPPSGPAEPEIITRADISRFYADQAAGRFRGREAEAKAYEAQIFEATRSGRIQ